MGEHGIRAWGFDYGAGEDVGELVPWDGDSADARRDRLRESVVSFSERMNALTDGAEPAEDLRIRLHVHDALSRQRIAIRLDGETVDEVMMADESEGVVELLTGHGDSGYLTEERYGHVEIVGLTDEQRREHIALRRAAERGGAG